MHVTESGTLAFRVALSVLRHREDAEDVAQEAVVRSLQRFDSLRDRTRFRAWLVRITWRLALDRRRGDLRRAARDFRSIRPDATEIGAEHQAIERERAQQLWTAIDRLPERLRLPLVLSTLQGHTVDEVASLLQLAPGTVKSRTFKARRKLKQALVGTGVGAALIGVLLLPAIRRAHGATEAPQPPPIVRVMPDALSVPAPVEPVRPHTAVALAPDLAAQAVVAPALLRPVMPLPVVAVPTVAVKTIEFPKIQIAVVELPVVDVSGIDVQSVKGKKP